jgi:ankyrin repeat protein
MNNLIFAGVLMGGSMAFNMGYAHKAIYTTQSSSPGNPYSTIDITKTSQHIVLKSIMANDFASFKKYASPSKYFNNHNDLHISPFQLAVIYNNTDMVQYMIKNLKSIPNMNLSIMPEYNNKADNYSLLLLPQIMQTQTPGNNNFGFASKKLLIEAGADVSLDNYKIVSSTLSNPEWRSFWKQYFEKQNKTAILKSLMKDSIKDKEDLIRDIHNIEALTKSL